MLIAVATHHMPHDVISVGAPRRGNGPGPSSSSSAPNHWYEHAHALMATDRPNHDDPREFEYRALRQSLAMLQWPCVKPIVSRHAGFTCRLG